MDVGSRFTMAAVCAASPVVQGFIGIALTGVALAACGEASDGDDTTEARVSPGALVRMDMSASVGVLLDEIPAGPLREAAARNAIAQPHAFWIGRANRQIRLTTYRLVFRGSFSGQGPLPLPPPATWHVALTGRPHRATIDGHDLVVQGYDFHAFVVSDAASPGDVEPKLKKVGGTAQDVFVLPADPELLFERTGYACMDEVEFPPNSVFEENTWYYYDDTCTLSVDQGCHVTETPTATCKDQVRDSVGREIATMHFKRVAYDPAIAAAHRVGTVNPEAIAAGSVPDLGVVRAGLTDERAAVFRFFAPNACDLGEGTIGQLGWRRLMTFSAIVQNDGTGEINMGDPNDPDNPFVQSNAFEFSTCHQHFHFSHYGTFKYGDTPGTKRAFCLEDTNRYHNNETTSLQSVHQSCEAQGITPGWGDEYNFGLPGQWVDVTGINTNQPHALTFDFNPDRFLCEGNPVLDANGNFIFDPTDFTTQDGQPQSRIRCDFLPNADATNVESIQVREPDGSFVTDPCTRGQIGPLRSCGFAAKLPLRSCTTGSTVNLTCTSNAREPQVLRVCENSAQLGTGVACTARDSIANAIIGPTPTAVSFRCPGVRDAEMVPVGGVLVPMESPGLGGFSLYHAALGNLSSSDLVPPGITCTGG